MDSTSIVLPPGEPPALCEEGAGSPSRRQSLSAVSRRSTDGGSVLASFGEILQQIQELQSRLREVYEQDVGDRARPNQLSPSSTMKSKRSLRIARQSSDGKEMMPARSNQSSVDFREPEADEADEAEEMVTKVSSNRAASQMVSKARQTTTFFEQTLRRSDLRFQLGSDWNIPDETLYELEQNRLAVSSPQGHNLDDATRMNSLKTRGSRGSSMRAKPGCAMHPESRKRLVWDCLAFVILSIEVLTAPLQVYNVEGVFREVSDVLSWVTTGYWFLDVPASFLTAVYIHDILHTHLADVAKVYLKGWFWFDMAMLAPEVFFFVNLFVADDSAESDPAASGVIRALRARRLVRVVRLFRLMRFRKVMVLLKKLNFYKHIRIFLQGWVSSALVSIFTLMLGVMVAVHFLASLWFVAGDVEGGWARMEGLTETSFAQQYTRSIEWAVSRLPASSLRANVELKTAFERWLAILATFVSLCISSLFVSVLTNIMADVARKTRKMTQILDSVRKYCGTCGVSMKHTMAVRKMVERNHFRASLQEHMQILETLPPDLVGELFHEARSLTLACHPFFLEIRTINSDMERDLCNHAVEELYLLEQDTVFHRDEKGQGIFILASGAGIYATRRKKNEKENVQVAAGRRNSAVSTLLSFIPLRNQGQSMTFESATTDEVMNHRLSFESQEGVQSTFHINLEDYLSEQSLWIRGWKYHGHFEVTVESRAVKLRRNDLRNVLQDYSEILATAVVYARSFVSALNKISQRDVSDMPFNQSLMEDEAETRSWTLSQSERLARVVPSGD